MGDDEGGNEEDGKDDGGKHGAMMLGAYLLGLIWIRQQGHGILSLAEVPVHSIDLKWWSVRPVR